MATTLRVNNKDMRDLHQGMSVLMLGEGARGFRDGVYRVRSHQQPHEMGLFRAHRTDWHERGEATVSIIPGRVIRLWLR